MRYQINQSNYANFKVFCDNRLPQRAYFIPYSDRDRCMNVTLPEERYSSSQVTVLNGEWDFVYYAKIGDMPLILDTDIVSFDKVPVPSVWQMTGYEKPYYTNQNYQFALFPPKIPTDGPVGRYRSFADGKWSYQNIDNIYNSVGVYRKMINIPAKGGRYILSFLGVTAGVELYVNGKYHGYGEGSHNTQEFDITDRLVFGDNEIVVVVHKWTNGTYLEAQDMFRHNGIFRDVLLYNLPNTHIYDYAAVSEKTSDGYDLKCKFDVINGESATVKIEVYDGDNLLAEKTLAQGETETTINLRDVKEWSAEIPSLYTMCITLTQDGRAMQYIRQYIGFKNISIQGEIFTLNGRHIYLKGVNRHDTNSKTGYYCTPADIEQDIRLMKEYNVNAIRTSHYPPDPLLIQLCNYYGLYVIDEADIETHGCNGHPIYNINRISNNPKWKYHYWDRVHALYERDKNNICVLMWSLGNESGGYKCHDYCYNQLKKLTSIPIHYEGVIHTKRMAYDVISEMYTEPATLIKIRDKQSPWDNIKSELVKKAVIGYHKLFFPTDWIKTEGYKRANKPFLMCEYAHAMGVGPGGLEAYWQVFYSNRRFMGGCIWEWVDHTIDNKNGKYRYTYGGDHDEPFHDGCFCVDGLMFTDRTPHTGALEMKAVYRPIRSEYSGGKLTLYNTNSFLTSDYLDISYTVFEGNTAVDSGKINDVVAPGSSVTFNFAVKQGDRTRLDIVYRDKTSGRQVAVEQHILSDITAKYTPCGKPNVTEDDDKITVSSQRAQYIFDKKKCTVSAIYIDGQNMLSGADGIQNNIFRAPIDNDMYIKTEWKKEGYYTAKTKYSRYKLSEQGSSITVTAYGKLIANEEIADVCDVYTFDSSGAMNISCKMSFNGSTKSYLPRIGKAFKLDRALSSVTYSGSDTECYPDFCQHGVLGEYTLSADGFMSKYVRPQESGNRMHVEYARFADSKGRGIQILADEKPYNLCVKTMTDSQLAECGHIEDMQDRGFVYVNADGFVGGVGSNSCGPAPQEQYRLTPDKEYKYSYTVLPLYSENKD